jgi:starch phosphorylase
MSLTKATSHSRAKGGNGQEQLHRQYGCGPVEFTGTDNALYERRLLFDNVVKLTAAGARERFEAVARSVRASMQSPQTTWVGAVTNATR